MAKKTVEDGFSLIELLVVVAVILIIAAIAIPNLIKSQIRAREAAAVSSLHVINTACQNYALTYGTGFPANLSFLGPAAVPSASAADLLDSVLASGVKSGYAFTYTASAPVNGIITGYVLVADPTNRGATGQRGFYTDQALVIHSNATGTASSSDPPIS